MLLKYHIKFIEASDEGNISCMVSSNCRWEKGETVASYHKFDCVPHQCLLSKLKAYGIAGSVLNLVTDFLSNRRQRVNVNGSCSD